MADVKNYGLSGVASNVQLGKKGPSFSFDGNTVSLKPYSGYELVNLKVGYPSDSIDAVNAYYLTDRISEISWKKPVKAVSTSNLDISTANGSLAITIQNSQFIIDGVSLQRDDCFLLVNQTNAVQNGVWWIDNISSTSVNISRRYDFNNDSAAIQDGSMPHDIIKNPIVSGSMFFVIDGNIEGGSLWYVTTTGNITIDTTPLNFTKLKTGEVSTVDNLTIQKSSSNILSVKGDTTKGHVLISDGNNNAEWGELNLSFDHIIGSESVKPENGGTGLTQMAMGDIVVGSGNNACTRIAIGKTGQILTSNGTEPAWSEPTRLTDSKGNEIISVLDTDKETPVGLLIDQDVYTIPELGAQSNIVVLKSTENNSIRIETSGNSFVGFGSTYNNTLNSLTAFLPDDSAVTLGFVNNQIKSYAPPGAIVWSQIQGMFKKSATTITCPLGYFWNIEYVKITIVNPINNVIVNNQQIPITSFSIGIGNNILVKDSDFDRQSAGTYLINCPVDSATYSTFSTQPVKILTMDASGKSYNETYQYDGNISFMIKYSVVPNPA